jgi:hypothetical protein
MKKYFAESVYYRPEDEETEAKQYLELWKKYHLRRLSSHGFAYKELDSQYIDREDNSSFLHTRKIMSLKLCLEITLPYEIGDHGVVLI